MDKECEVCGINLEACNDSDNPKRCIACYEEFGDEWPDKI